ncbi:MAG: hypothetical protein UHS49_02155 [Faecalimonas sp.]|nr:hypothetical protein [Faecalimonas sp.]
MKKSEKVIKSFLKIYGVQIMIILAVVLLLFIASVILHTEYCVLAGVLLGFVAFFYYRNKFSAYKEAEQYERG